MTLDRPELRRPFLLSVTYGPDSATRIVVRDSVARTERVATLREYPSGALSILGLELALQRARERADREITVCLAERPGPSTTLRPPSTDPRCSDFRSHFANRTAR